MFINRYVRMYIPSYSKRNLYEEVNSLVSNKYTDTTSAKNGLNCRRPESLYPSILSKVMILPPTLTQTGWGSVRYVPTRPLTLWVVLAPYCYRSMSITV